MEHLQLLFVRLDHGKEDAMEPQLQQVNCLAYLRPGDAAKVPENFKFCAKTNLSLLARNNLDD